ncbi:MAG TPA: hypothetical protein V6C65_37990 [Allocoleopsis sp.]
MDCPFCSDRLVRHIQHQQLYWFCRSCWERIPILPSEPCHITAKLHPAKGSAGLVQRSHPEEGYRPRKERIAAVQEVA